MWRGADLAAAHGRWWAVWARGSDDSTTNLYEAHTLGGVVAAHRFWGRDGTKLHDMQPSLAWQPDASRAVLAWTHARGIPNVDGLAASSPSVVLSVSTGGRWVSPRSVDAAGMGGQLAVTGGTVVVADLHYASGCCSTLVYVGTPAGAFGATSLGNEPPESVTAAPGRILVLTVGGTNATRSRVHQRINGAWSTVTMRGDPVQVQAAGERARVFLVPFGDTLRSRSR